MLLCCKTLIAMLQKNLSFKKRFQVKNYHAQTMTTVQKAVFSPV